MTRTIHIGLVCLVFFCPPSPGENKSPQPKHRRGEGLILKQPVTKNTPSKGTPPGPPPGPNRAVSKSPPLEKAAAGALATPISGTADTGAPCDKPLALEALFSLEVASHPAAVHNGVYFLRQSETGARLFFQKRAGEPGSPAAEIPSPVGGLVPSPNGERALVWGELGGAWWVSPTGKAWQVVDPTQTLDSAAWGPDGTWMVAMTATAGAAQKSTLTAIYPQKGEKQVLAQLPFPMRVLDVAPNGTDFLLASTPGTLPGRLATWSTELGLRTLIQSTDSTFPQGAFSANGRAALYLALRGETGRLGHLRISPPAIPKPITPTTLKVISMAMNGPRNRLVLAQVSEEGGAQWSGWELSEDGTTARQYKMPTAGGWSTDPASIAPKQDKDLSFFFSRSSATQPSQIWRWNGRSEELWADIPQATASRGCWSDSVGWVKGRPKWHLWMPRNSPAPIPFLITPTEQTEPRFRPQVTYLNQRGFGVLVVPPADVDDGRDYLVRSGYSHKSWIATLRPQDTGLKEAREVASELETQVHKSKEPSEEGSLGVE